MEDDQPARVDMLRLDALPHALQLVQARLLGDAIARAPPARGGVSQGGERGLELAQLCVRLCRTRCMDSAVHLAGGARCGSAPCAAPWAIAFTETFLARCAKRNVSIASSMFSRSERSVVSTCACDRHRDYTMM